MYSVARLRLRVLSLAEPSGAWAVPHHLRPLLAAHAGVWTCVCAWARPEHSREAPLAMEGCFYKLGGTFGGDLIIRTLLFWVFFRVP